ncbi:unnamed protein product [Meloidogyne enterolobii]|uniref:Uncharacterized protein n=2 Tax=Meloidogyne enterolobii TaxID=390850 RepID=A0ACB0XRJ8_MELEN
MRAVEAKNANISLPRLIWALSSINLLTGKFEFAVAKTAIFGSFFRAAAIHAAARRVFPVPGGACW